MTDTFNAILFGHSTDREEIRQQAACLDRDQLVDLVAELAASGNEKNEKLNAARQRLFGKKSEQIHMIQRGLFDVFNEAEVINDMMSEEEAIRSLEDEGYIVRKASKKKSKGRHNPSFDSLPEEIIDYYPESEDYLKVKDQCSELKTEDRVEIEYIPVTLKKRIYRIHCFVYTDEQGETHFFKGKAPEKLIENSFMSPSLASSIISSKVVMGLPLYRQEQDWNRKGIRLPRQTMAAACIRVADDYLKPLFDAMVSDFRKLPVIHMDETVLQVNEVNRKDNRKKSMMVVATTPEYEQKKMALYQFEETGEQKFISDLIGEDYHGLIMCDGKPAYSAYPKKQADQKFQAEIAGCNAHARRKFADMVKSREDYRHFKKLKSEDDRKVFLKNNPVLKFILDVLDLYRQIYHLESIYQKNSLNPEQITEQRQKLSSPLFDQLTEKIKEGHKQTVPSSAAGKACSYFMNNLEMLQVFLKNGLYPIDNNAAERMVKPFVIARKGFLFSETVSGAQGTAICFSIQQSAILNGLIPEAYLSYVLTVLKEEGLKDEVLNRLKPYSGQLPKELYAAK